MNLRETPFLRMGMPLLLGILSYPSIGLKLSLLTFIFLLIYLGLLIIHLFQRDLAFQLVHGLLINLLFVFLGLICSNIHDDLGDKDHYTNHDSNEKVLFLKVLSKQAKSEKQICEVELLGLMGSEGKIVKTIGRSILNLSSAPPVSEGDSLIVKGRLNDIKAPLNPEAFDFKAFYLNKKISHRIYCKKLLSVKSLTQKNSYQCIKQKISDLNFRFNAILEKNISSANELAVAKAILIGDKTNLNHELKSNFADTGAMHVLAVSGLHVGLISLFLLKLFSFFDRKSMWYNLMKSIFIIGILWIYAFICGASPSILRACCMYSFIIFGRQVYRNSNIFNTIGLSAFILLLFEPSLLYNLSFQLSYAALFGIVYFQHKIYCLYLPNNKILDWAWKLVSVSIAAQLTTFPLSLYYFHQFPLYFWLSGLIVIPAAFIILLLGISLFLFDFLSVPITAYLSQLLEKSLFINNHLIGLIKQLPVHKVNYISLDIKELYLLYALIILLIFAIEMKSRLLGKIFIGCLLVLAAKLNIGLYKNQFNQEIVFYHSPKKTLIDFVHGQDLYTFQDQAISEKEIAFASKGLRSKLKIKRIHKIGDSFQDESIFAQHGLFLFKKSSLLILDQSQEMLTDKKITVDYLLLSNDVKFDLQMIKNKLKFTSIIIDASNSYSYTKNLTKELNQAGISFHNIKSEGALRVSL